MLLNRALGPAVAIYVPFIASFISELSSQRQAATSIQSWRLRRSISSEIRRFETHYFSDWNKPSFATFLSRLQTTSTTAMSFANINDTKISLRTLLQLQLNKKDECIFSSISITTASHEEAVLLEEPTSTSSSLLDERTQVEAAPQRADEQQRGTNASASKWRSIPETLTVQGVTLPATKELYIQQSSSSSPLTLYRNGHGIRTVRAPFGITVHVYIATLYSLEPIRNTQDVVTKLMSSNDDSSKEEEEAAAAAAAASSNFIMEYTFLRAVTPSQMSIAWNFQLDTSVTESDYEGYEKDRTTFLEMLNGSMDAMGTITFEFRKNGTMTVINQGQTVGQIHSSEFIRAFCSMWFGEKPVMAEIKTGLLQADKNESVDEDENNASVPRGKILQ